MRSAAWSALSSRMEALKVRGLVGHPEPGSSGSLEVTEKHRVKNIEFHAEKNH